MVQIPAKSVAHELTKRIKKRAVGYNKHRNMYSDVAMSGVAIKNTAALAQLLADMLFDSKDSEATADGTNVEIYFSTIYTPEFTTAHNNSPTHLHGEDIFIVHQGRKLYRYEFD